MSANRQNAFKRNLLVKQRSCFETISTSNQNRNNNGADKKFLTKKLSIDNDNNTLVNYNSGMCTWTPLALQASNTSAIAKMDNPESSLRIGAALKKRSQPHQQQQQQQTLPAFNAGGIASSKNEHDFNERSKKPMKGKDSRLNINIFLAQNATVQDGDASDDESPIPSLPDANANTNNSGIAEKNKGESSSNNPAAGGGTGAGVAGNLKPILSSAAAKRAQFQSSRGTETLTSVERERPRPPLVRAMSAPIRPLDDSMKQLQNKRKARRRKNFRDRDDILELDEDELNDSSNNKNNKNRKPPPPRTRSALGCDIETLVSLLSSGGSDSEKEESSPNKNELPKVRTPMLRKTVSFQENESANPTPTKDLSTIFRRGSVAPLAAKIRANRPPTAPAGSIFLKDFQKSENKAPPVPKQPLTDSTGISKLTDSNIDLDADNGTGTPKERECWRLFQKMTAMGLVVSYDTILRGMLTPTELRMLQKQKDMESARQESVEKENGLSRNASLEKENVKKEENKIQT